MRNYEKPIVLANEELSEGVYAASGNCYTVTAVIMQQPDNGRGDYRIQLDAVHAAADDHHSTVRRIQVTFNQAVEYVSSQANSVSGSGSNTLVLEYVADNNGSYHNNAYDNLGLGNLVVTADPGLAITGKSCVYCNRECSQH